MFVLKLSGTQITIIPCKKWGQVIFMIPRFSFVLCKNKIQNKILLDCQIVGCMDVYWFTFYGSSTFSQECSFPTIKDIFKKICELYLENPGTQKLNVKKVFIALVKN